MVSTTLLFPPFLKKKKKKRKKRKKKKILHVTLINIKHKALDKVDKNPNYTSLSLGELSFWFIKFTILSF
jgi:hypothetical protein